MKNEYCAIWTLPGVKASANLRLSMDQKLNEEAARKMTPPPMDSTNTATRSGVHFTPSDDASTTSACRKVVRDGARINWT